MAKEYVVEDGQPFRVVVEDGRETKVALHPQVLTDFPEWFETGAPQPRKRRGSDKK